MPFDRFLSVAALTPAQASLVAVQVLDAADLRGTTDGQHAAAGAALGSVTFTPSGDIDVTRPHSDKGMPVTELLKQLVQNARRLPAHPRPEQLELLDRLEAAARDPLLEPRTKARELERALTDALGSGARQRLSGQLAALVDAYAHVASGARAPIDAGPPAPGEPTIAVSAGPGPGSAVLGPSQPVFRPAALTRHAPSRPHRRSRAVLNRRTRRRRVALAVVVLTAVLAGSGYVVLGGPGAGVLESLGRGSHAAGPATSAPTRPSQQSGPHRGRAAPALAPPHAGPVTGVTVHKTARCRPGALCPVMVTVHVRPASTTRAVSWKVGSVRLCKRGIAWSPRTKLTARPGWRTVYARSSVRVPKGRSLAIIALTVAPARAQSRPVPVTGSPRHC